MQAIQTRRPTPHWMIWVAGGGFMAAVYAAVFLITRQSAPAGAMISAISNAVPLVALGFAVFRLSGYAPSAPAWSAVWHGLFGSGFVIGWMTAIALTDTALRWMLTGSWNSWWFSGPGLTWQVLQGFFVYALLVIGASYVRLAALHRIRPAEPAPAERADQPPGLVLIQLDDGLVPLDPAGVFAIEAMGDYVSLVRNRDRLLVKMTLSEIEARLAASGFIRVHRSWLVRLAAVSRFEPAGQGRWRALLTNGEDVPVSRTGMKMVRDLVLK